MTRQTPKRSRIRRLQRWLKRGWPVATVIGVIVALGVLSLVGRQSLSTPVSEETQEAMKEAGVLRGDPDAAVTIYEFADYQCPACRRFSQVLSRVKADYIATGEVNHVFIDLPLTGPHRNARQAAISARCAGRQGSYWRMHDALFQRQSRWANTSDPTGEFIDYAEGMTLDREAFSRCLDSDSAAKAVDSARALGQRLGVAATPTVIVGKRVLNRAPGSTSELRELIEAELP